MEYFLERNSLSDNKILRRQFLDKYFSLDLIGYEECLGDRWRITTFIPDEVEYYIDPKLNDTLANWIDVVSLRELTFYKRFYKNCMISFVDSWSLYYWSLCLKFLQASLKKKSRLILFHIDDHRDHDTPLIYQKEGQYYSLLSQNLIDLLVPDSIVNAIREKAISIGSFISLLIHEMEAMDIFHLKPSAQNQEAYALHPAFEDDNLLLPGAKRPSIDLRRGQSYDTSRHYFLSSSLENLMKEAHVENDIVFLHIDCDAFNNRFNGSSQWSASLPSIQLNMLQIKKRLDHLLSTIGTAFPKVYLNIALSPGFFPSEYWKETLSYIISMGEKYGIIQEDDFSAYLSNVHPVEVLNGLPT